MFMLYLKSMPWIHVVDRKLDYDSLTSNTDEKVGRSLSPWTGGLEDEFLSPNKCAEMHPLLAQKGLLNVLRVNGASKSPTETVQLLL